MQPAYYENFTEIQNKYWTMLEDAVTNRGSPFRIPVFMCSNKDDIEGRLDQLKRNFSFFGAPIGMIITVEKEVDLNGWGHVGHFIQNICLASMEFGLGTCLQESWSMYPETVKNTLQLDDSEILWCGIAIGYPDNTHPINNYRTSREEVNKFTKFF